MDAATIKDLKSPTYYGSNVERKTFCLQEFFDTGQATWEHVMHTIASDPLNKVVGAKEIGFEHDNYRLLRGDGYREVHVYTTTRTPQNQ